MSSNITSYPLGNVLFQSGKGLPNHISTKGSIYIDLETAIAYINKDGLINWVEYYDTGDLFDNFLTVSGGTVYGSTVFTGGLSGNTIFGDYISGSSISATTYYNLPEQLLINNSSTGLISFDGLSFTPSATTYNVGAIKAWFVDNISNPTYPSKEYVEFSATTGNTLDNLTGQNVTYIAINSGGTLIQQSTPFNPNKCRDEIPLGVIVHSNRIFINTVNNQPLVILNPINQITDLIDSLGLFNISGNTITANGNNLTINKSIGEIFKRGINFINQPKDPHSLVLSSLIAPSNIRYRLQNSTEYSNTQFIDPNNYDLNGILTPVPNTKYTVQRIYLFQSNLLRIQYGQKYYDSLDDAASSVIKDSFNVESNLIENGLLRCLLIVKQGTTDLTDLTKVRFLDISRFGIITESNLGNGLFRSEILNNSGSGLINGGNIISASTNTVNITSGSGRIVNNVNNPDLPSLTQVNWGDMSGITITNLTGQSGTSLFINSGGTLIQQNITTFTNSNDFRDKIYIGSIGHPTGIITTIFNNPMGIINPINQFNDLSQSIGPFSINGNKLSKITGTLKLFKSSGKSYFSNANYQTDKANPSIFNVSSFSGGSLSYVTQNSFLGFVSSDINTTQYDLNGVLTTISNNHFVAHRIWHQPSDNIVFFQYGQAEYSTLNDARSKFATENYITPLPLEFGAYLIGVIIVRKGETNLDDPTRSEIIVQGKFAGSGSGSGGSVDTLQSAYDNSITPEIITDSTRGAITLKNGAGIDTLNILETQNSGGTTTFSIKSDGSIQSNTLTGSTTKMVIANSGGTLSTQNIIDTYTTGGTFSNSTATFTNNIGETFNVTGFTTPRNNYVLVKELSNFPTPTGTVFSQNFELNTISPFTTSGSSIWATQTSVVNSGTYAAKSGVIGDNQSTQMSYTVVIPNVGATLSFYYKVSSESGFDFLRFYIDGVQQNQWSGEVDWTQQTYNLSGGSRTLKWEYSKDVSVSSGSDAAYIDNIQITTSVPVIYLVNNITYEINGSINIGNNVLFAGNSNTIFGLDKSDCQLIYTGNTSFINNVNNDLSINNVSLIATNTGSSVFNFIGTSNKIEIKDNIFLGNKSLGIINGGDVSIFRDNLVSTNQSGLTLTGIFDNIILTDNLFIDNVGSISLLNFANININNLLINRNQFEITTGQTAITVSNMTLVTNGNLGINLFLGSGTPLNGFSHNTSKWLFTGNQGIPNKTREVQFSTSDMNGLALSSPTTAAAVVSFISNTGTRFYTFRGGAGQDDGLVFTLHVPSDYYSGGRFDFNFTTDTTLNNIKLFMAISKTNVGSDFTTLGETGLSVVTAGVTQYLRKEVSISPITTTFNSGDILSIKVWRDPDDIQDTSTANLYLNNIQFVYNSI